MITREINSLIEELPDIKNQAKEDIGKFHEKQKLYHDKKNRIKKKFKIEDKVLYYAATKNDGRKTGRTNGRKYI